MLTIIENYKLTVLLMELITSVHLFLYIMVNLLCILNCSCTMVNYKVILIVYYQFFVNQPNPRDVMLIWLLYC